MQVMTRYSQEINRCGDYKEVYTCFDFGDIPDAEFKACFAAFCHEADGEVIVDYSDTEISGWGEVDYNRFWVQESKRWVDGKRMEEKQND